MAMAAYAMTTVTTQRISSLGGSLRDGVREAVEPLRTTREYLLAR
jgi:hypothetical protein